MIDHSDNAVVDPIGQHDTARCPHLGTRIDADTWFTFAAAENYCHKASPPQPINMDFQSTHCLGGQYGECPVYQAKRAKWIGTLPPKIKGKAPFPFVFVFNARNFLIFGGVIGALALAAFAAFMILPRFLNQSTPPQPTATVPVIEVTETPQPTIATPSATPTETEANATPTVATTVAVIENDATPTVTLQPIFASVAFATNLRDGPSTENAVLASIPGGTEFLVLGRDTLGVWLYVDVEELGQGWVFAEQIEEEIEILTLPVIYVGTAPTSPAATSTNSSAPAPTDEEPSATPPPTPPQRFDIILFLDPAPGSCDESILEVYYDVTLRGDNLIMDRSGLTMTGDYDPETGEFEVEGTFVSGQFAGVRDTMTGTMIYENRIVIVEATQTWTNTGEGCPYVWFVEGESEP